MATGFLSASSAIIIIPLLTLALGFLIGYLAQRSGFCSIGGWRDLFMFRHTRLFFGYMALIAGGILGYFIFWLIIPAAFPGFYWAATAETPLTPFTMLSCSRCGTARGYIRNNQDKEYKVSEDVISGYLFCNLNKIIDFYEKNSLILAPNWGSVQFFNNDIPKPCKEGNLSIKNPITIFITHSPYGSEWTFGGLSFAMACANHGIHTNIVFIEDGIYCIHGNHKVNEKDKIFNIQDIIIATSDILLFEIKQTPKDKEERERELKEIRKKYRDLF